MSSNTNIQALVASQRTFFKSGATFDIDFRMDQLIKLKNVLIKYEQEMIEAAKMDMGRADVETYFMEINMNLSEVTLAIKQLRRWSRPKTVKTPLVFAGNKSRLLPEPYGVSLIFSAWNYPFLQLFSPLIGAIAAGNTAILKPAQESPNCSSLAAKMIREAFDARYISVVEGDVSVATVLLEERFDKIFFTGSPRVGRIIHQGANKYLTPVTLELGGKSPAIVDRTSDLQTAAKKIMWAKLFNAGQICVTVDHVYVHESVVKEFVEACKYWIKAFYTENPQQSEDFGYIINARNFDRVTDLIKQSKVAYGGNSNSQTRYVEPTLLYPVSEADPIMQEEIFGPVLPILTFKDIEDLILIQNEKEKPLALYVFSKDSSFINEILDRTSSGGVTINDCMAHGGTATLPFGGVGNSGMGNYHGKYSFDSFSHYKPVMHATSIKLLDLALKYPPYKDKLKQIRLLKRFGML